MSFGKSSGSSAPVLTQEQKDAISAQTKMLTENIIPTYTGAVQGAKDIYNKNAGGVLNAAQNLGGTASKAQQTLGDAGANQALMAKTAADTQAQIAQQRMAAANSLASLGQGGIGQALGAAGQQVSAAMTPQQLYNQYASVIFGTPAGSYTPDFRGTQGTNTTSMNIGGSLKGMFGGGG